MNNWISQTSDYDSVTVGGVVCASDLIDISVAIGESSKHMNTQFEYVHPPYLPEVGTKSVNYIQNADSGVSCVCRDIL